MRAICLSLFVFPAICHAESFAFIGSPISVEKTDISCKELVEPKPISSSGLEEVCMDSVFRFRYEISSVVLAAAKQHEVVFLGAYHYRGLPDFVVLDPALVILKQQQSGFVLLSIKPVEKRGGSWWVCQNEDVKENCTE